MFRFRRADKINAHWYQSNQVVEEEDEEREVNLRVVALPKKR